MNKSKNYSPEQLFKLLKNTDFPETVKKRYEYYIKVAAAAEDQALLNDMAKYLIWRSASSYGFEPPNDPGDIHFYLGSNVALYGPPGTGKSMLLMKTAQKIYEEYGSDITMVFPDVEGDISRILPSMFEPGKCLVFTKNTIRLNPLQNVEISDEWLGLWSKPFTQGTWIGDSGHILNTMVGHRLTAPKLVSRMGGHATFYEIIEEIMNVDDANLKDYRAVTRYRLDAFKYTLGPIWNYRRGYDPDQLKGRVLVYNLSWMDSLSQLLMVLYLLEDTLFKAKHGVYGGKILYFMEEFHRVYRSVLTRQTSLFEPTPLDVLRSGRKRGLVLVTTDHSIHNSPDDVLDTSDTKIIFRHTDRQDLKLIESALNLNPDLTPHISEFENRQCLWTISGQMSQPEFHTIPDIEFTEYPTDEVDEIMKPYIKKLSFVPVEQPSVGPTTSAKYVQFLQQNSKKIQMFLNVLTEFPTKPVSVFSKKLTFDVQDIFLENMADCRLITYPKNISFGKRGPSKKYVEIIPKGADFIGREYQEVRLPGGKNKTLQSKIAVNCIYMSRLKDGGEGYMEKYGADVYEKAGDSVFCWEYETEVNPHLITNLKRDLTDLKASRVYIVLDKKSQEKEAKAILKPEFPEADYKKISFRQTSTFL